MKNDDDLLRRFDAGDDLFGDFDLTRARRANVLGILDREPGSAYGLSFPALPGVLAASDDLMTLDVAARDALALVGSDQAVILRSDDLARVLPKLPPLLPGLTVADGMFRLDDLVAALAEREDALDLADAEAILARIDAGEETYPASEVARLIEANAAGGLDG